MDCRGALSLEALRELFLTAPESGTTRFVGVAVSLALLAAVLALVRQRRLAERYTPIWLGTAFAVLLAVVWPGLLTRLTRILGAWTPSSAVFFVGEVFLIALVLDYAVELSEHRRRIKNLAQEVALLTAEMERRLGQTKGPEG